MNKAMDLKNAITYLFRTGADGTHDTVSLLNSIDYHLLLQSLLNDAEIVYQYQARGASDQDFTYYGPELFVRPAILLYEDLTEYTAESCLCSRTLELWLLTNMRFAVASCFNMTTFPQHYVTEYRTYKDRDWRKAGMMIQFPRLAEDLEERCAKALVDPMPMCEE